MVQLERAGKGAKRTGNTHSFRVKMLQKNRHFRECSEQMREELHTVAKMYFE